MTARASARATDAVAPLSEAVVRLTRASHSMRTHLVARDPDGLDWAGFALLFQLVQGGPRRPSTLAEAACVDPSTVSKQVTDLARLGLVERRPDPADGRATLLVATAAGVRLYEQRRQDRIELFRRVVEDWPIEDVEALTTLLERFTDSFFAARTDLIAALAAAKETA